MSRRVRMRGFDGVGRLKRICGSSVVSTDLAIETIMPSRPRGGIFLFDNRKPWRIVDCLLTPRTNEAQQCKTTNNRKQLARHGPQESARHPASNARRLPFA